MATKMTTSGAWVILYDELGESDEVYTMSIFTTPQDCLDWLEDEIQSADDAEHFHIVNLHDGTQCHFKMEFYVEEV